MFNKKKYKLGLCLSGGAARGMAHAGVLKALNQRGIYPDAISGVSAGAMVGAMYALGHSPDDILHIFKTDNLSKYLGLHIPKKGVLKSDKLGEVIKEYAGKKTFDELNLPLFITAIDYLSGKEICFDSGLVCPAVLASSSVPLMFEPVTQNSQMLFDGGLVNNLPVEPLEPICKNIIGVNVNHMKAVNKVEGMKALVERTVTFIVNANMKENIKKCSLYIEPEELANFSLLDVASMETMFNIGYDYTHRMLENNRPSWLS